MDGGGALINQGIHGVDWLRFLCGEVKTVSCFSKTLTHAIEAEDTLAAAFECRSGAIGVLTATTSCYPGQDRRLEIGGDQGTMTLQEGRILSLHTAQGPLIDGEGFKTRSGARDPFNLDTDLHRRQIKNFIDCVFNHQAPSPNGAEAAGTLRLIFALYASARDGRPVEVPA
jgi:predicted dehydrogenase